MVFPYLRKLTPKTIKILFDPKELVIFVLPTTGFYYQIIPKFVSLPRMFFYCTVLSIFVFLFLIGIHRKVEEYEKKFAGIVGSIPDVLERPFFQLFLYNAMYMYNKMKDDGYLTFQLSDGTSKTIKSDQIKVKLILPLSLSSLEDTLKKLEYTSKICTIGNNCWLRAKFGDDTVTIYEYPRSLLSVGMFMDGYYSEEKSEIFHRYFNDSFNRDWCRQSFLLRSDIFIKINKLEE